MTTQPKLRFMVAALAGSFFAACTGQTQAAGSCPALPNAELTFSGALSSLIARATGASATPSGVSDPVRLLDTTQQQKLLEWMREELTSRKDAIDEEQERSAAKHEAEDLARRIFTRDQMESDASLVRRRVYDRAADGTLLPSSGKGKGLGQLIDEEMERDRPSLADKYKDKYKAAILSAIQADPARVGEFAGALSAGDYGTVVDHATQWGAQGFGAIVGDVLDELGHENSKVVWDGAVKRADAAAQIARALAAGRTGEAWTVIADEWKAEVKTRSRDALKAAVNFAFDAGSGAGAIGDFIPRLSDETKAAIAPEMFKLTPGDLYLKLLDAEISLIEWSHTFLREKWSGGDAGCIQTYNATYERTKSVDVAYEEFATCIPTAGFSAMHEFSNQAKEIGIDETAAIRAFLEAQRQHAPHSATMIEWIGARAAAIARNRDAVARQLEPELMGVHEVLFKIASRAGAAMNNRLTEMVSALLNKAQLNLLADEIKQLKKVLNETLIVIDSDLERVRRYSGGIDGWCTAYDQQKPIARKALADGINLSVRASGLRDRISGIDTAICDAPTMAPPSQNDAASAVSLAGAMKTDRAALSAAGETVCAAPDSIRKAPDKTAGRSRLDAALASAREAGAILARLNGIADQLSRLKSGADVGRAPSGDMVAARERTLTSIAAARRDIDALAAEYGKLIESFRNAHDAMRDAQQHIDHITDPTQAILQGIEDCLRPLASAPVAERQRAILAELEELRSRNAGCKGVIVESWNVRDVDPPSGGDMPSSAAWRHRSLSISPTPDTLRDQLGVIEAKCRTAADGPQSSGTTPQIDWPDLDAVRAEASAAGPRTARCAADALVAYQDKWGKPVDDPAKAAAAESALSACRFKDSRQLIDALPEGPRRTALVARWNKAYEAERRARDLVKKAVELRKAGERGKAIGMLHEARELTTCEPTVATIDKAIAGMSQAAAPSAADLIAAATADCRRSYGGGYRAGDRLPDGRYRCVPDQVTANAKCDEFAKAPGHEAFNIKNDGTFSCRMGKVAAANWCRAHNGAGFSAVFNKDRSRVTCIADAKTRTALCVKQFGAGWRAGDSRSDGGWTCYGPKQQVTTPRAPTGVTCPPGHIPTQSGGCLNIGGIMQGLRDPVQGLTNPPARTCPPGYNPYGCN